MHSIGFGKLILILPQVNLPGLVGAGRGRGSVC